MNMSDAWVLPLLPAAAFVVLALFGPYLPRKGDWLAILAIGAVFVLTFPIIADFTAALALEGEAFAGVANSIQWMEVPGHLELNFGVHVDGITIVMLVVVSFVALMVQVYSLGYMKGDARYGWYYAVISLFVASMLALVLADNFLLLYFSWELVGLCSYLLIGHYSHLRSAAEASKKAFITTRLGDVGLLIAIILLWRETGTLNIQDIIAAAQAGEVGREILTASVVLLFLGAMGKSAQFPFHVWLPDAMEGPTPVSALIHAATMVVAGVYLVARMLPLFELVAGGTEMVLAIGLMTTFLSATMGLVMTDIKRVIAYSTLNSLGLMFVALGVGSPAAAMLYLFTHAFFKALLFLGAGSVIHATERQDVSGLGGLFSKMPLTGITFAIGAFSMAGLPFLAGFWAKDEILVALLENKIAFSLVLLTLPLTALYMMRVFVLTFLGEPKDPAAHEHAHEGPPTMAVPLVLLAVLTLVTGFVVFDQVGRAMGFPGGIGDVIFLQHPHAFDFNVAVTLGSIALVAAGLGAGWYAWVVRPQLPASIMARLQPVHTLVSNEYYLDDLYQAIIDRVILAGARVVAWFDRNVVNDTGIDGAAYTTGFAAYLMKFQQTGKLPNYALAMVIGIVALAVVAFSLKA
ncbi:MAG: NADH-quinone oxidoreductase subunit L [Chloroflexi bacterium]|nr:NADH-quinone oxidoreductase subunit L [Chloroflexota bacterium]